MTRLLVTTAAITLALSTAAFAQTTTPTAPAGSVAERQCKDLTGAALDSCLKAAPGRSGDATAREGGRTPGASESAASRTGTAPGQAKSGTDATGGTAGGGATGKGAAK
jgi:uncharacterized membrane protein